MSLTGNTRGVLRAAGLSAVIFLAGCAVHAGVGYRVYDPDTPTITCGITVRSVITTNGLPRHIGIRTGTFENCPRMTNRNIGSGGTTTTNSTMGNRLR